MPIRPIILEVKRALRGVPNSWVRFMSPTSVWVGAYPPHNPTPILADAEAALRAAGYHVTREDRHPILTVKKVR